jgi:DNA invertase Pin-like site-specific DNA recombinase
MNNTVIYCRIANGSAEVMAMQLVAMNQYTQMIGYTPYATYCDWNESGATLDRPSMQKLLSDIRAGEVRRIIVKDLSRLARSLFHIHELIHIFVEHGVELISASDGGVVDMTGAIQLADAFLEFARTEQGRRLGKRLV